MEPATSTPETGITETWLKRATALIGASLAIRLLYLGGPDLIPEEAYYWLYARNLDFGYLDHPPAVAWLIWLGTLVFGHNEFGVRSGALLCWFIAAFFLYRLGSVLFSKPAAWLGLMFFSCLPFFASIGWTIAPDSPLIACWSGALYFLSRALIFQEQRAWYAVGLCVGLGLLSKYTIILLGPATLIFCLLHAPARRWLTDFRPWLAAVIALAVFSPVLYWNHQNGWASFVFQGPRRFAQQSTFGLPELFLDMLILVAPGGLLGAYLLLTHFRGRKAAGGMHSFVDDNKGKRLFTVVFLLTPIVVFALYSLRHATKLNWTGPAFLVLLPALGQQLLTFSPAHGNRLERLTARSWLPTLVALLLAFAIVLHYVAFGFPGLPYSRSMRRFIGWHDLGQKVTEIAAAFRETTGKEPVVAGLDKHNVASELAFYTHPHGLKVIGRAPFKLPSLMFQFWDGNSVQPGQDLILVGRQPAQLSDGLLKPFFTRLDPIQEIQTFNRGKPVGVYFYRLGYGFKKEG